MLGLKGQPVRTHRKNVRCTEVPGFLMLGQSPTVLVSFVCPFVWEGVLRGWGPYFLPQLFLKVISEQEEGSSGKSSSPFLLLDLGVMEIRP